MRSSLLALITFLLVQCKSSKIEEVANLYDLEGFMAQYNQSIKGWLEEELDKAKQKRGQLEKELKTLSSKADRLNPDELKKQRKLTRDLEANHRTIEKYEFRQSLGDMLAYKTLADIPDDLNWEDGMDEPEIGDPRAIKGGTFNTYMRQLAFPATLRPFGPNANSGLRSEIYTDIEMTLLFKHPVTDKPIPGLANRWALSKDQRTMYFKINPKATYSNGEKIYAKDMFTAIYIRASDNVFTPYFKQYIKEQFANITVYDDHTLSCTLPDIRPDMYYYTGRALPAPECPSFYSEYGPDYVDRYQWRVPPTTGAYDVKPENVSKGRSVTLTRVKDWWAKDLKYYRYRFNPDRIRYLLIRYPSKCYELFKVGEIDMFSISAPSYWYEKTEVKPVFDGYIEKKKFYTNYPLVPLGLYLNMDEGILKNKDVRLGINHSMNMQKVNDQIFRGDYVQLNQFSDGFDDYTDPSIKARDYNPRKAREYFSKAGFTEEGEDRILRKPTGEKLSFSCTITQTQSIIDILQILKKSALDCGIELRLDVLEDGVAFAKMNEKRHQSYFSGWGVKLPSPKYRQFFHSDQAFDEAGNRKHSTNNMNSFADERMDIVSEQVRNARTKEELTAAAFEAQQIVHDSGVFVPGVYSNYAAYGHWRWIKWPDSETTKFCFPKIRHPQDAYLFWIDEKVKEETLKAKREGKTFPEVEQVIDDYRISN